MTTQEAYEQIRAWFSKPDAQFAYDEATGSCFYRPAFEPTSPLRCAVGCLLLDEPFVKFNEENEDDEDEWERLNLTAAGELPPEFLKYLDGVDWNFIGDAQILHDRCALKTDVDTFLRELDEVARGYNLNVA